MSIFLQWIANAKSVLRPIFKPPLHKADLVLKFSTLGSSYGGWPLLQDYTPNSPLIFSFGVGEDVSFDLAAIQKLSAVVHAFDPTPRSLKWVKKQNFPDGFNFYPIGIADHDGVASFHAPENDEYVSFSVSPADIIESGQVISAPVNTLSKIITDLKCRTPDVLKLDIEGFEYTVLPNILAGTHKPAQLLVEFHHGMYGFSNENTLACVLQLKQNGYLLFSVSASGREYGFVHRDVIK